METYNNKETAATRQHMANMQTLAARAAKRAKINARIRSAILGTLAAALGAYVAGCFL